MQSISQLVKERENTYVNGISNISKYVDYSQYETISTIEAYLNSRHTSGQFDALGREKPFFNICTAVANIWMRATDIDRKNIRFRATKQKEIIPVFLANCILQNWMREVNFGSFLNEWGRVLSRYGSAVTKFVERDGLLDIGVASWNKLITDQIDFENNVKIFKFYLTPAQLRLNPTYDQEVVKALLETEQSRETLGNQTIDTLSDYIELYEVQGNLPLSMITDNDKDDNTYCDQIHIISFSGKSQDFSLYKGKLKKQQYHKADLIKEDGRALGIGAVEHLFQAQWMSNHSVKLYKDQMELVSKVIYQTADKNYAGRNALTSIENGDIFIHEPNSPLTQVNNTGHDLTSITNFMVQWQTQGKEITSTPDAISGNTMPSGTAYRQVAILNQESHSLFELMTENKGLALEEMFREWIIPYIRKQLNNKEEIAVVLDDAGIKQLDTWYTTGVANKKVNQIIIDKALNAEIVTPEEQASMVAGETSQIQSELSKLGNQRFIKPSEIDDKTWKDILDINWDSVEVEITNEQSDKEAVLTTLTTVMQTVAQNPAVLQDPNMKLLFNKILEMTGQVSSVELSAQQPQAMQAPQQQIPQTTP
jgi:hypothetical protein